MNRPVVFFSILLVAAFYACNSKTNKAPEFDTEKDSATGVEQFHDSLSKAMLRAAAGKVHSDSVEKARAEERMNRAKKYFIQTDSIVIYDPKTDGQLVYTKEVFNRIVELFPALYSNLPEDPEISYASSGIWKEYIQPDGQKNTISFGSEAGQDEYYLLYAWFLKKEHEGKKYAGMRDTLVCLYRCINEIFSRIKSGGTYFGHQYARLMGDAEYSIYCAKAGEKYPDPVIGITKQKALYMQTLQQMIKDELQREFPFEADIRQEKEKILYSILNRIHSHISNLFYLRSVQEFHYRHYIYF